ncbi:MAG: DUF1223 domain-containing protein [Xanthobacteraceae bacterium]
MRFRLGSFCLLAAFALPGGPAVAGDVKAVVELFTSQGCSSCPRADKLLGELAGDARLIALSLSVDYWDYLGWRDTLALHSHSMRQKGYANQRGDRQVYTPQVVINGAAETIGSDRYAIDRVVGSVDAKSKLSISVALKRNGNNIEIEVGAGDGPDASVWIIPITNKAPVTIDRGENRGKTITYHNVVRSWTRVGEWKGAAMRSTLAIADLAQSGADAAAVLVQSGSVEAPGPIRGAALIALR